MLISKAFTGHLSQKKCLNSKIKAWCQGERARLSLEPLTACLIHSMRFRKEKGKLSHWLLEMMKTTIRT